MTRLTAYFYDKLMANSEDACLREWRRGILAHARGEVLEIGAGTGASIELYPRSIGRLILTEPDRHMRRRLEQTVAEQGGADIQVRDGSAEQITAEDESLDCVVASLVCCSVADLDATLREIRRVLKPGGRFLFMEHVAADPGTRRRVWQDRINPLWSRINGGCNINRETEAAIAAAGFEIRDIQRESMRKAMPIVRPTIRGFAARI